MNVVAMGAIGAQQIEKWKKEERDNREPCSKCGFYYCQCQPIGLIIFMLLIIVGGTVLIGIKLWSQYEKLY